jgi:hypothetical protein
VISARGVLDLAWYQWRRHSWVFDPTRFLHDHEEVVIDRPIFLLGNQGDGLTLVSRILRRHPEVVSITGNCRYWSGADEMQSAWRRRLPKSLEQPRVAKHGAFFPEGLDPPHSWCYASDPLIGHYRRTATDAYDTDRVTLYRLIRETLHRHGRPAGCGRFIDKSQVFTVKLGYLETLLRERRPHFVLVTRNPYATCLRAATGGAGDIRRYRHLSLEQKLELCCQHWGNAMQACLTDAKDVAHFTTLRFEDLLENTEEEVRRLCRFLQLPYTSDLLPSAEQRLPFGSRFRDRWYPLRPDVNERYLESLSRAHLEMIEGRCGRLADSLGYPRPR